MSSLGRRRKRDTARLAGICVALLIGFQLAAFAAQYLGTTLTQHQALDELELRISLDAAYLDVGNAALNTPVNNSAVQRYLARLNSALFNDDYPLMVSTLQSVNYDGELPTSFNSNETLTLTNSEQAIVVEVAMPTAFSTLSFSPMALLFSLILMPFYLRTSGRRRRRELIIAQEETAPVPLLIIDLKEKTLGNGVNDVKVVLQNKPLCFYTALVKYCMDNPDEPLQHHKDVPTELLNLANKVFGRLIELGHTKRKRPDFNANLDKTLSEVRAALDEVFAEFTAEKERYYPPRAQGEGSRSKQHSFALTSLSPEDVEIIGN